MDGTLSFEARQLTQWGSLDDQGQQGGGSGTAENADHDCGDQDCGQPTLAFHYDDAYGPGLEAEGGRTIKMVPLPPSSTGKQGRWRVGLFKLVFYSSGRAVAVNLPPLTSREDRLCLRGTATCCARAAVRERSQVGKKKERVTQ